MRAYNQSAATLNLLRGFSTGGYASLDRVLKWNLDFMSNSDEAQVGHSYCRCVLCASLLSGPKQPQAVLGTSQPLHGSMRNSPMSSRRDRQVVHVKVCSCCAGGHARI